MPAVFHTTRWSVVLRAGGSDAGAARDALEELALSYWYPLYAFARRSGAGPEEAADLVQGWFAIVLERGDLSQVARERGRFRAWLRAGLKHHLLNERERAAAQKRGGAFRIHSLESGEGEERYLHEPADPDAGSDPEHAFELSWARSVLELALGKLGAEYAGRGRDELFEALRPQLLAEDDAAPYAELARALDTSEGAVKVAVHRLRQRFGAVLRSVVADTVADESELDAELAHLAEVLAG